MQVALHRDVFGSGAVFAGGRERRDSVPNPLKSDLGKRGPRNEHLRWTPHPVLVTILDNEDYIRVL